MARYTGPRLKLMRAVGMQLPGLSRKSIERRPNPPGVKEGRFRKKKSEFGTQLLEKQKLRYNYGISEKYLRKVVGEAFTSRGHSGHKLLEILESRLDSVVFRAGFAPTIPAARQLVSHNHIRVDGKRVNIASYRVRKGQVVTITDKCAKLPMVVDTIERPALSRPAWLTFNTDTRTAQVISAPDRDSFPFAIEVNLVVEYYARSVKR